jgi:hypothetical protein
LGSCPKQVPALLARIPAPLGFVRHCHSRSVRLGGRLFGPGSARQPSINQCPLTFLSAGPWDRGNPCLQSPQGAGGGIAWAPWAHRVGIVCPGGSRLRGFLRPSGSFGIFDRGSPWVRGGCLIDAGFARGQGARPAPGAEGAVAGRPPHGTRSVGERACPPDRRGQRLLRKGDHGCAGPFRRPRRAARHEWHLCARPDANVAHQCVTMAHKCVIMRHR